MTLVELLTAMMVSVMLIGTAVTTFWTATQAWEKAKRRTEMLRLLEGSADLLIRHLRSIQPPFDQLNPTFIAVDDNDETGDYDSICFLSDANPRYPQVLALADICEVEFYIETGERGAYENEQTASEADVGGLWMRIDPTPDDDVQTGGYLVSLGEKITGLDFQYFDGYEWVQEWFYDTEVPEAIEFTITVTDPDGLENPMTLTRLVTLPTASLVNSLASSTQATSTESGSSGQATPSDTTAAPESGSTTP